MNQLNTEREQRFVDLAAGLADDFAPRAAQHDEEASFPHENYARLRETGYTIMTIPERLGGLGATLLERLKAQERLAQGCGATALAINMHFNVLGLLIDLYRKFKAPNVEEKLRRIASERLICGGSGSEPDNAVINLRPRTTARRGRRRLDRQRAQDLRHAEHRAGFVSSSRRRGRTRPKARPSSPSSFRRARLPASSSRTTGT